MTPLKDTIKVLNGFGRSLEWILPKLKYGYLVEDSGQAQNLASKYAEAFFLTPEGECFHNTTVTGGKPASEGPLALKRDLRETEKKLAVLESLLRDADAEAALLERTIEELTAQLEARSEERRQAERDTANQGAALKQMEAEVQRIDRRLQEWTLQAARNKDAREAKAGQHGAEARRGGAPGGGTQAGRSRTGNSSRLRWPKCGRSARRCSRKRRRVTAELAGLEERRRGAETAFQRIDRLHADLERRVLAIEQQRAAAEAEREQRISESATLAEKQQELAAQRAAATEQAQGLAGEAQALRQTTCTTGNGAEERAMPRWTSCATTGRHVPARPPSCGRTWSISKPVA